MQYYAWVLINGHTLSKASTAVPIKLSSVDQYSTESCYYSAYFNFKGKCFDRDVLVSTNHDQFLCSVFVRFDTLEKIHKTHILLSLALHEHIATY